MAIIYILTSHVCAAVIPHTTPIVGTTAAINAIHPVVTAVGQPTPHASTVWGPICSCKTHQEGIVCRPVHPWGTSHFCPPLACPAIRRAWPASTRHQPGASLASPHCIWRTIGAATCAVLACTRRQPANRACPVTVTANTASAARWTTARNATQGTCSTTSPAGPAAPMARQPTTSAFARRKHLRNTALSCCWGCCWRWCWCDN